MTEEIRDRTWDGQRLSALGSWSMTWGKLVGSTVFVWYGALICLVVYAVAALGNAALGEVATEFATLVAYGVLCHAAALLASLLYLRHKAPSRRPNATMFHVAGLAAVVLLWVAVEGADEYRGQGLLDAWSISQRMFELLSVAGFALWSVIGVWRLMRAELQFRNLPWLWTLFALYLVFYVWILASGPLESLYRLFLPIVVLGACTYFLALVEPKDVVGLRRLAGRARAGDLRGFFETLPLWLLTYVFVAIASVCAILFGPAPEPQGVAWRLILVAFLFMTRDLGILLALNLGRNPRRADVAAIVYWVVLYALVPMLLRAFGLHGAAALFQPGSADGVVISVLVQSLLALAWVVWRWRAAGPAARLAKAAGTGQIPA